MEADVTKDIKSDARRLVRQLIYNRCKISGIIVPDC